ncbi:MAG: PsbP-related protein [Candidatus Berkelbacteria bacterium]|nr:PsbP-related protein [Candidatus Berkelbacteria bacterium]
MKPVWMIVISVVITAGVIGGGTYYLVNSKATKDKDNLQSQITDLNKKVADAEQSLATAQSATATTTPTTTPTTSTATTTDPTAEWKTYTNATYKFSVKYPSSATPKEINAASFTVDFGSESISAFSSTESLTTWVSGAITDLPTGYTYTKASTTLDGVAATKLTVTKPNSSDAPAIWIFSVNSGKHYEVMSDTSDTNFSNFIATFKFTK